MAFVHSIIQIIGIALIVGQWGIVALEALYDDERYSSFLILHQESTLFRADSLTVFIEGQWCGVDNGCLDLREVQSLRDESDETLGKYSGKLLKWSCRLQSDHDPVPVHTIIKNFHSSADILFQVHFPDGAHDTSTIDHNATSHDGVSIHFPALHNWLLNSVLSWQGSFVSGIRHPSTGPEGGPTVFSNTNLSIVVSPWGDHVKAYSSGTGLNWNATREDYYTLGTSGRITSFPVNYTQSILMHLSNDGIHSCMYEFGKLVQDSRPSQGRKLDDVTLNKIGYQTDNGAYYCFCSDSNCSNTLIRVVDTLREEGINLGYLSFQGKGASTSDGKAPWCVTKWGLDGGLGQEYPVELGAFQKRLGIPLQLYAPYFCPSSTYFNNNDTAFRSISSDTSLPGCDYYDFQNAAPEDSKAFYDGFLGRGRTVNMVSFEPDFMNQNHNCVPEFIHNVGLVEEWQHGMAQAAFEQNIAIQWCYATPTDVLNSVNLPSVTNVRVSFDFCYGESYKIGTSSLLVWAMGARPSKDTLWTAVNNHTAIPGCPWTQDHEVPELHLILALMSMGPVGISDAVGQSNATLLKRAIGQDGTLLQPRKPLTTIESVLLMAPPLCEEFFIFGTYSYGPSWIFVSFSLKSSYTLSRRDFWPQLFVPQDTNNNNNNASTTLAVRAFTGEEQTSCRQGQAASACGVRFVSGSSSIVLPATSTSSSSFSSSDLLQPTVTTVYKPFTCGETNASWFLLGDLSVYVSMSRIPGNPICNVAGGFKVQVEGTWQETILVTALVAINDDDGSTRADWFSNGGSSGKVVQRTAVIPRTGAVVITFAAQDVLAMSTAIT